MSKSEVIFGWDAPPMAEQHPVIGAEAAEHFDRDNQAVIRLHLRGVITDTERNAAFKRLTKRIAASIRAALSKAEPTP